MSTDVIRWVKWGSVSHLSIKSADSQMEMDRRSISIRQLIEDGRLCPCSLCTSGVDTDLLVGISGEITYRAGGSAGVLRQC